MNLFSTIYKNSQKFAQFRNFFLLHVCTHWNLPQSKLQRYSLNHNKQYQIRSKKTHVYKRPITRSLNRVDRLTQHSFESVHNKLQRSFAPRTTAVVEITKKTILSHVNLATFFALLFARLFATWLCHVVYM